MSTKPSHPGAHVRENVIPKGLSVTEAAKKLGVGRPALSNFLNGKAALSPEMAARLETAFGADRGELLNMQTGYSDDQQMSNERPAIVKGHVPPVEKISARQIAGWATDNIQARSELPALLRRLVNSTTGDILSINFPAFDNAERPGWDGTIDAGSPTPWVPVGKSGWEFGCNQDPKAKATKDYQARVGSVPNDERTATTFVFVTPQNWPGKKEWVKARRTEGQWKDVRAYDASDLEQWLEVSAPAQIWLSERMGSPVTGYRSLTQCWEDWAKASEPALSAELFTPAINNFRREFSNWLKSKPDSPFVIAADSRDEALAFLSCIIAEAKSETGVSEDKAIVFDTPEALLKMASASDQTFVAVADSLEVEKKLTSFYRRFHCIIVRFKNQMLENEANIALNLLSSEDFKNALEKMGIGKDKIAQLDRDSGRSPTILRRRLSKIPAIKRPDWEKDHDIAVELAPFVLAGAWNADKDADCQVIELLADVDYGVIEKSIAKIENMEDTPLWPIDPYKGVASKIDALYAIAPHIVKTDLDRFFFAAEYVLSEVDPAFDLPENKRFLASIYEKVRDHSSVLRNGICETIVLFAVHGNALFRERLGIDVETRVADLIRKLLTPLNAKGLYSNNRDLPNYAEAAPEVFLQLIEEDLQSADPTVFQVLKPVDASIFGSGCPRTGLLWALECLAWNPKHLLRVTKILAKLSTKKINDNWTNKPEASLRSIFRCWLPQTSASVDERIKAVEHIKKCQPAVTWRLCAGEFWIDNRIGNFNYKPRWRDDASGAGWSVTDDEHKQFLRKAIDICLNWSPHDDQTLGSLVMRLSELSEKDQESVWNLIDKWIATEPGDDKKAALRECVRQYALTRRRTKHNISMASIARARIAYKTLTPLDLIVRHQWLFASSWVPESYEDMENDDIDYKTRDKRIQDKRISALNEIMKKNSFDGVLTLLRSSEASNEIGWIMYDILFGMQDKQMAFIKTCLKTTKNEAKTAIKNCLRVFLSRFNDDFLFRVFSNIGETLAEEQHKMLFFYMPFGASTWRLLDDQPDQIRQTYWENVETFRYGLTVDEISEAVDSLIEWNRPLAAFQAVAHSWEEVDTKHLIKLLQKVATSSNAAAETVRLDRYDISKAFDALNKRAGVSVQEKATLEFAYFDVLENQKYGIPNLEKEVASSPELFTEFIRIAYKRDDGGEDPKEWETQRKRLAMSAYRLLNRLQRTPGTDLDGTVKVDDLKEWLLKVRELCRSHARVGVGDVSIGQLLSQAPPEEGGDWPSRPICEALEWMDSKDVGRGFYIGVVNARGAHWRQNGGDQERELVAKYRAHADRLKYEFPYVARLMDGLADSYEREAKWHDTDAKLHERIPYGLA